MAGYSEESYHEGYAESERDKGPGYYQGSENNERGSYSGPPEVVKSTEGIQDFFLQRRQSRFDSTKFNYATWDSEREYRPFSIFPRNWWRAKPASHLTPLELPVDMVVLTYSHGRTCVNTFHCSREVRQVQSNHLQNGAVDVVYNFMIGGNGQVFEGRGWHSSPRLNHKLQRLSRRALQIAFLGNLGATMPSEVMFQAARDLVELGVKKQFITPKFLEFSSKLWSLPYIPTESEVLKTLATY